MLERALASAQPPTTGSLSQIFNSLILREQTQLPVNAYKSKSSAHQLFMYSTCFNWIQPWAAQCQICPSIWSLGVIYNYLDVITSKLRDDELRKKIKAIYDKRLHVTLSITIYLSYLIIYQ